MSTLLIDNYDSYTYNVFHLLAGVSGEEPIVVHNDMVTWKALSRWDFDAIVLSPGPGRPQRWHDFGVCADILRYSEIPVLGICLGHQGLGHMLDGHVRSAPIVMHGRLSNVEHDEHGLFAGIPQAFSVVRYHSLAVTDGLGDEGRVTAWTADGVVMGIEHRRRPMWGVQFHPESVATEHGSRLVENFYRLAAQHRRPTRRRAGVSHTSSAVTPSSPAAAAAEGPRLLVRTLQAEPDCEALFERLFGGARHAFWLDSADAPTRLGQRSHMGTSAGGGRCVLEYDVEEGIVLIHGAASTELRRASVFSVLDEEIAKRTVAVPADAPPGPLGGFVGYLGYECKADCGAANVHSSDLPDAVLMLANRLITVDHLDGRVHLLAIADDADLADAEQWLEQARRAVLAACSRDARERDAERSDTRATAGLVEFSCGRGREQYLADIARCQAEMAAGESYEVCLTDQISTTASPEPFSLYRRLRTSNPAPFAAYLKLGELAVLSSSPERFLSVGRDRVVEARPIKGTIARSPDPARDEQLRAELAGDEKTYAEHLMIVDLLRNDLGRVCEVDSVRVPELMAIEPYPTVHQMVSTVTGQLEPQRSPVECVRACFPGGSMTGAPKLRTMEIIDDIEDVARGVYSGALGYFGLDGSVDLSIVIRTIVMRPGATMIGAGGAIVIQSDPEEEFEEILLKARAPMAAIASAVTGWPGSFTIVLEPAGPEDLEDAA
jgi:para-aminobenzoate synthetase